MYSTSLSKKRHKYSWLHDREALHTSFEFWQSLLEVRGRICRRLRSPGIDSEESNPPAYVTWRAGTGCSYLVPTGAEH